MTPLHLRVGCGCSAGQDAVPVLLLTALLLLFLHGWRRRSPTGRSL
ncbi:MAG: MYXO-CTERM sorting domain-containing protein [Myxococcota bacterium]